MRKLVLGLVVAVGLLVGGLARASYVCTYNFHPENTNYGSLGFVIGTFYTAAHCSGTFLGTYYFCSTGATAAGCAIATTCGGGSYLYDSVGLHSLAEMLQQAEIYGKYASPTTCGSTAGAYVTFSE